MGPENLSGLVVGVPAAVAVIIIVRLFLAWLKDFLAILQTVVAKLTEDHKQALDLVMAGHERSLASVMERIEGPTKRMEIAAQKYEALAGEVHELTTTIRVRRRDDDETKDPTA